MRALLAWRRRQFTIFVRTLAHSTFPTAPKREDCCNNACQQCVWIRYADQVLLHLDETAKATDATTDSTWRVIKRQLDENVEDVALRAYLEMEIRSKLKK